MWACQIGLPIADCEHGEAVRVSLSVQKESLGHLGIVRAERIVHAQEPIILEQDVGAFEISIDEWESVVSIDVNPAAAARTISQWFARQCLATISDDVLDLAISVPANHSRHRVSLPVIDERQRFAFRLVESGHQRTTAVEDPDFEEIPSDASGGL